MSPDARVLTHLSLDPYLPFTPRDRVADILAEVDTKPRGFWYSVDGGWEDWCTSEVREWLAYRHRYDVTLGQERVLRLTTAAEVLDFAATYRRAGATSWDRGIAWERVTDAYDGIEVAPYAWELRFHPELLWYWSWDCDSGCIWRPRGMTVTYREQLGADPDLARPYPGDEIDSEACA